MIMSFHGHMAVLLILRISMELAGLAIEIRDQKTLMVG
jgi:hypothetical protein